MDCSHRVWGLGVYILECSFMNSMMIAMIKWVTQIISVPWVELGKDSIYPRTQKCDSLITYSIGYPRMMRNEVFVFSWPSQMWPYMTSIHSSQHHTNQERNTPKNCKMLAHLNVILSNMLQHWRWALPTLSKMYLGSNKGVIPTLGLLYFFNKQSISEIFE